MYFYKQKNSAFREISQFLYEEAELKYPEAKYKVIGGFIFLRWICPAIVSPQEHGLVERKRYQYLLLLGFITNM